MDSPVAETITSRFPALLSDAAGRLELEAVELGGIRAVREKHLEAAMRDAIKDIGIGLATNKKIPIPHWLTPPRVVGNVDLVVSSPDSSGYRLLAETKWCQADHDKVYEAIWDLFKMALASTREDAPLTYLVTAATSEMWPRAFCADLLDDGVHTPEALCQRRFPKGSKRLAWDDLLEGGYDRYPDCVPAEIRTFRASTATVRGETGTWEIKAVQVQAVGTSLVPFDGGWPWGQRPPDARAPVLESAESDSTAKHSGT
jgi:hypothetical protein